MISAPEQPFCSDLVIPAGARRHVPTHRISQPIVDIEEERHFQRLPDRGLRYARTHDCPDIVRAQALMLQRHRFQQTERGAKLFVNGRRRVIVQNLLDQMLVLQG